LIEKKIFIKRLGWVKPKVEHMEYVLNKHIYYNSGKNKNNFDMEIMKTELKKLEMDDDENISIICDEK